MLYYSYVLYAIYYILLQHNTTARYLYMRLRFTMTTHYILLYTLLLCTVFSYDILIIYTIAMYVIAINYY